MYNHGITITDDGRFEINGYPDGVYVAAIPEKHAKKLGHLALHHQDLIFASECLDRLNRIEDLPEVWIVRQSLFSSAVISFYKCFGYSKRRSSLQRDDIYKEDLQKEIFEYYKDLRDKKITHDENDWTQSCAMAVVNRAGVTPTVPAVHSVWMGADMITEGAWNNMSSLTRDALAWVTEQYDSESDRVRDLVDGWSHESLLALPAPLLRKPGPDSVGRNRPT
ncbi:hypothetical protein OG579_20385 [Williamsia herbipolensis]|uniref:Uncharacterized protein n=1 Tax=Williamsia herbipolensis TaxID=1603258 RepID=A0AAU4K1R2_9NOCA|nr:hypothetical protein [Williamsia herbipolensis]